VSQIQAKVAAIISESEVAISAGRKDGVQVGMIFAILSSRSTEIKDPDTGEVIGTYPPQELTRVQAVEVQDRMAICATYVPTGPESLEEALEALIDPRVATSRSLPGSLRSRLATLNPTNDYVRIGDRVRQVDHR
jgi:hypothetical protein